MACLGGQTRVGMITTIAIACHLKPKIIGLGDIKADGMLDTHNFLNPNAALLVKDFPMPHVAVMK